MKKKFKKIAKKIKKMYTKIINDQQLLAIFILILLVLIVGTIVIGFLKMLAIVLAISIIGFICVLLSKKYFITDKKITNENNTINSDIDDNMINDKGSEEDNMKKKKKKKDSKKRNTKQILNNIVTVVLIIMLLCIFAGIAFMGYIVAAAPEFNPSNLYRKESSIVYSNNNEVIAKLGSEIRRTITFDDMPQVLIDAIIATEDSRYYQHNGVDLPRFIKAAVGQVLGNSGAGGGSTITMQVSKQAYTSPVRNGLEGIIRKFTDVYLAIFKLEKNYTKEQILEYYVNIPGLGSNSFGVAEASETYFGKDVSELNLSEAALLAGLFQAPTAYNPYVHPDTAAERRAIVLRLMRRHGYITEEQEEMANAISVESLLSTKLYENPYQNFIDVVVDEVYDRTGENPYNTPMKIYTTLDKDKQDHLNKVINGEIYTWVNDKVQVGVAVTDVETGGIIAISGGRHTVALGYNRATQSNNQPGSSAKPIFDYAPGIEYNNWSTYTPFIDEAHSYSNGIGIKNWDNQFYGFLTLRESLGLSRNIPALKAFQNVSNNKIYNLVTSLGITPEMEGGLVHEAHSLGAFNGTTPLEMAAAYAAFSNGGYYIEPYTITKIVYLDTNVTKEYKPTKTKVMEDSTAYIITNSLVWAVDSGLSGGSKIYGRQIAAKTGTTNFSDQTISQWNLPYGAIKDYWVAGYTPKISMALWYGYDKITDGYNTLADNNRKDKVYSTIMKGISTDSPKNFKIPDSVVAVQVEKGTIPAMLPSENTPKEQITTEYFKKGTEPTMVSPRYQQLGNPNSLNVTVDNKIATLTWKPVNIPDYYTDEFMDKYIRDGMGDTKKNYIEYRQEELEKMGQFGYDIYIIDKDGNEKYLTTTTETNTSVDISKYSGEIKFVVKTAWENDKTTISSGSEYTLSTDDPVSLVTVTLKGNSIININVDDEYIDESVVVLDNFVDVTSDSEISYTITNSNNESLSEVDTSTPDTYKIKYKVIYKHSTYEQTRVVNVLENANDSE